MSLSTSSRIRAPTSTSSRSHFLAPTHPPPTFSTTTADIPMNTLPASELEASPSLRRHGISDSDYEPLLGNGSAASGRPRRWSLIPTGAAARKKFGMMLLGIVVFLWVSSNFLTYAIFSDDTYSKPYFVTYLNTSTFCLYLLPSALRKYFRKRPELKYDTTPEESAVEDEEEGGAAAEPLPVSKDRLNIKETMRLGAEFCLLWFFANYFNSYCLKFTSVASATILSSTSSMFTLIIGSLLRVERFTYRKLLSVIASLVGITLVSMTHLTSPSSADSSSTSRTALQILLGDSMALLSALAYATYITLLKVRVGDESRVDMQLFFGFVGLFNVIFLGPGFFFMHYTGIETFEMPPQGRVWAILAVNASITLTSDFFWAYAMLLTTPLVVTVGLSLTIPLALLGQMVLLGGVAGIWYWVGAGCVFVAFWFLNKEEDSG